MAGKNGRGDLEIGADIDFQRRWWTAERVGWAVMGLIVLAGLAGLFGSGPLARASAGGPDAPLRVEYDRFARMRAPTSLTLHLGPRAGPGAEARVWLDRRYLEGVQVRHMTPQPDRVELAADRLIYIFPRAEPDGPTAVTVHLQPERLGRLEGRAGVEGGSPLHFRQLVYP